MAIKEDLDKMTEHESVSKKSTTKRKPPKKEPNLLEPEEGEGELQVNTLFLKSEKEIPEQVCIYKDKRGRLIIETACELTTRYKETMPKSLKRPPAGPPAVTKKESVSTKE